MLLDVYRMTMKWAGGLNTSEWMLLFFAVVVIGMFCLKGFGSRSSY